VPKPADDQDHALADNEKLEEGLQDSMDASHPPSVNKTGRSWWPCTVFWISRSEGWHQSWSAPQGRYRPRLWQRGGCGRTSTSDENYDGNAAGGEEKPNFRPPAERHPSAEDIIVDHKKGGGFW